MDWKRLVTPASCRTIWRLRAVTIGVIAVVVGVGVAAPALASPGTRTIHGLVYEDANGDGVPSAGERGVPGAVVALDVRRFVVADASGQFELRLPDGATSA